MLVPADIEAVNSHGVMEPHSLRPRVMREAVAIRGEFPTLLHLLVVQKRGLFEEDEEEAMHAAVDGGCWGLVLCKDLYGGVGWYRVV